MSSRPNFRFNTRAVENTPNTDCCPLGAEEDYGGGGGGGGGWDEVEEEGMSEATPPSSVPHRFLISRTGCKMTSSFSQLSRNIS